jgi:acyl carrier protein
VAYVVPRLGSGGAGGEGEGPAMAVAPGAWESDPELAAVWQALAPELRRFLAAELPEALVPAVLVPLAALPLTANGKVNRAALPAPESAGLAAAHVPPDNPIEEAVAATTAEVLGLGRAGMTDNFFGLGGHSLLATQLVSRLVQEHGLPVSLEMVFDATDLRDLAARIAEMDLPPAEGGPFAAAPEDLGDLADAAGFPPLTGRSESEPPSGPAEGGR